MWLSVKKAAGHVAADLRGRAGLDDIFHLRDSGLVLAMRREGHATPWRSTAATVCRSPGRSQSATPIAILTLPILCLIRMSEPHPPPQHPHCLSGLFPRLSS